MRFSRLGQCLSPTHWCFIFASAGHLYLVNMINNQNSAGRYRIRFKPQLIPWVLEDRTNMYKQIVPDQTAPLGAVWPGSICSLYSVNYFNDNWGKLDHNKGKFHVRHSASKVLIVSFLTNHKLGVRKQTDRSIILVGSYEWTSQESIVRTSISSLNETLEMCTLSCTRTCSEVADRSITFSLIWSTRILHVVQSYWTEM